MVGKRDQGAGHGAIPVGNIFTIILQLRLIRTSYIAEMDTPHSVIGERILIHSPYWPNGTRKEWQWVCGYNC